MGGDSRTYFRMADDLPENRKIITVGGDAAWLHVCAMAYASRNLTDGFFPQGMVPRLSDRKQPLKLARLLLANDLWHGPGHDCKRCPQPSPGDYVIHDYLVHQRSAEEAHEARTAMGKGGSLGNHKRWHVGRGRIDPDCPLCPHPEPPTRSGGDRVPDREGESPTRSGSDRVSIAESESEIDRSITSLSDQSADRSDRVPDDPILIMIIQTLYDRTDRVVGAEWAAKVRDRILAGQPVANPFAYVKAAIEREPDPKTRFLPLYGDAA